MAAKNDPLENVLSCSESGFYEHPNYNHAMYLASALKAPDIRQFLVVEHPEIHAVDMGVDCLRVLYRALAYLDLGPDDLTDSRFKRLKAVLRRLGLTRLCGGEKLLDKLNKAVGTSAHGDFYAREILKKNAKRDAAAAERH